MAVYDPDNIFANIIKGEVPSHKVYEDAAVLAIMDVFPQSRGHTLVIPKAPSRNLFDADPATLSAVMPTVQKLARAVMAATGAAGLRLVQYNEAPAGQSVFHLHFHLIPAYGDQPIGRHNAGARADDTELAELARAIAAEIR
ncbi:MAG TPA: HIT family protein [Devosiaceae bacterium]|nr:HIT family protein [Devosiaceae bacterium]